MGFSRRAAAVLALWWLALPLLPGGPHATGQTSPAANASAVYEVTAYAPGCGDSGRTYYGDVPGMGTLSAPWSLPYGAVLAVPGYGVGVVSDRGGAITEGHLDVWLPDCATARRWGRQWLTVERLAPTVPEPDEWAGGELG